MCHLVFVDQWLSFWSFILCPAAEPPRKDSGECLLNKSLDTCSSAYGVVPHHQDNLGQPFVSKHFNVIDPLRANNNLGRSVSKGNYEPTSRSSYRWIERSKCSLVHLLPFNLWCTAFDLMIFLNGIQLYL